MTLAAGPETQNNNEDDWAIDFHFQDDWYENLNPVLKNNREEREAAQQGWEESAQHENRYFRSPWQKVLGTRKVDWWDMMLESAESVDGYVDAHGTLAPAILLTQKIGQEILVQSGIDPAQRFSTREELESALAESDIPYNSRAIAAYRKIDGFDDDDLYVRQVPETN